MITPLLVKLLARLFGDKFAAALAEALKVITVVVLALLGTWWLRHDAARDAATAANAQCQRTIQKLEDQHREEADRHAEDAQSAGEALPPTPAARRELERLCAADEACRDKGRLEGRK